MRWTATVAAALVALAAPAVRGAAGPCSGAFDALRDEVELRAHFVKYPDNPQERAEKKALARVLRRMRRPSSFRKDAGTAAGAVEALTALYPGDAAMETLLDGTLDGIRADLGLERDDLALTAKQLPGGDLRDAALAGVAAADLGFAEADALPDLELGTRPGTLVAAAVALEAGYRGALARADRRLRRTCGDRMWVFQDGKLLWRADRVTAVWQKSSNILVLEGTRARRPADDSTLALDVTDVFGSGAHQLLFSSGKIREFSFTRFGIVSSGTVTVTRLDEEEGILEGTFAFTARGCLFGCSTYEVTGGVFRIRHLKVL